MAWGYYDHPPLVALFCRLFSWSFIDIVLSTRLVALSSSIISTLFFWKSARIMGLSDSSCLLLLTLIHLSPLFSAGAFITTPDSPLLLFWSLALYTILKAIRAQKPLFSSFQWPLLSLFLALGILSKYTMLFFPAGIVLYFLLPVSGRLNQLVNRAKFWLVGLGLLIFLGLTIPHLLWNFFHRQAGFSFQLVHVFGNLKVTSPVSPVINLLEFLSGQAGIMGILTFFLPMLFLLKFRKFSREALPALLWCLHAPLFLFLLFLSPFTHLEANWSAPALPGLLIGGLWWLEKSSPSPKYITNYFRAAVVLALLIAFIIHLHIFLPFLPFPPEADPTSRLQGQKLLVQKINEQLKQETVGSASIHQVYATTYQTASRLNFYSGQRVVTVPNWLPLKRRSQYNIWPQPELKDGDNIILVANQGDQYLLPSMKQMFKQIKVIAPVQVCWRQGHCRQVILYRAEHYLG